MQPEETHLFKKPCAMNLALHISICLLVFAIRSSKIVSIANVFYPDEREALIQLRETVNSTLHLHSIWTGPPCHDNNSNWVGIECWNSHVIHIVLEGIHMTGSLPPSFLQNISFLSKISFRNNSLFGPIPHLANLVHLEYVFLSHNSFSASIPLELIQLPNLAELELQENHLTGTIPPFDQQSLTVFNVSDNLLEGQIPETVVLLRFSKSSYDNNLGLCGRPLRKPCPGSPSPPPLPPVAPNSPSPTSLKNNTFKALTVALIAVAAVLVPFKVMLVFLCYYKRKHGKGKRGEDSGEASAEWVDKKMRTSESTGDPERTVELEFFDKDRPVFDLDDLLRASAEMMGKGSLGSTYKAMLESSFVITVKRLKEMNWLTKKEFVQQMQLLGKMKHQNLVEIISFYYSKEEKLVISEYVPGGSLFEFLHENRGAGRVPLNWSKRLSIIKGIANGLAYLHQSLPSHKVPHANLKSSNVIIQQRSRNYHPKLTDFGFLPLLPSGKTILKLAAGKSPEASQGKKLTHKADVYCFGILLLEIITGRIPGEFSPATEDRTNDLSQWVRSAINQDWSTDILDLEIVAAKDGHEEMLKLTEIALECTALEPEKRPKMTEVLKKIEEIKGEKDTKVEMKGEDSKST
ncbi:putative leucine-rich repeat receptor-like protein kinase At1g68400 [Tasmannia lanceolata]|uniref:putative leucine-rich repeat receptor-like protein kinase At1g68400 n=1 Tax=Tasmannia lanceolata TaxID=3420 RepID=UPI004064C682